MVKYLTTISHVEISCKSLCIFLRKSVAKNCAKNKKLIQLVEITTFPLTFTNHSTVFPTIPLSLFHPKLFHFSTKPTITTIKYI